MATCEDVVHPERRGGEEVFGGGGECVLGFLGDGVKAKLVGVGTALEAGFGGGEAVGEVRGELVEVADDRRQAEEVRTSASDGDGAGQQQGDGGRGRARGWRPPGSFQFMMLLDKGREDDREEGADVDEQEDFAEAPDEGEGRDDGKGEEDVAADGGVAVGLVGGGGVVGSVGNSWWMHL